MPIKTLNELFLKAAQHGKPDCLQAKSGGRYQSISTAELVERVRRLAAALLELGVDRGDRVALMAENGPHWPTVDFATLSLGAVLVPIYPTLTSDQAAFIADDCGAQILVVQGRERLEQLLGERGDMPKVKHFVLIDLIEREPLDGAVAYSDLIEKTPPMDAEVFEGRARSVTPDDLATFIYTSGTTGRPKGVMLTHGNIASNGVAGLEVLDFRPGQTALSFLPLSHSFQRAVDYMCFLQGVSIAYAESMRTVVQNLGEVRPHLFVSVPRLYEKLLAGIREKVAAAPALRRKIFAWAESVGGASAEYRTRGKRPPGWLGIKLALADKLVFAKLRALLGGRFEFAVSGGAPLAPEIARFFWGAGIEIYEGYGMTEASPVITVNRRRQARLGTVGPAIPTVELHIAKDGEILARGPNIMKGYYNLPDKTEEVLGEDGWLHTGDIGVLDRDGFLTITDRKKEILVTAYGKNVAPAPIENALKMSRFVEQAVLLGDARKFVAALLVPDFEALGRWAETQGLDGSDRGLLLADERVGDLFAAEVAAVNRELAGYEQVRAFELLADEFTIESGELTPTQKVKRRVVEKRYADRIEAMYLAAEADRRR